MVIERTNQILDGINRFLNFIVMMLPINVHDRISDLLDLLSMFSNSLEVMFVTDAMCVNRS